ncbi:hypothetical protein DSC45_18535 [Streptomyces sp. YIM 130001]|nr:hypothetical protein DSC45_18535 [Streptomyces sp. YIM 130001]
MSHRGVSSRQLPGSGRAAFQQAGQGRLLFAGRLLLVAAALLAGAAGGGALSDGDRLTGVSFLGAAAAYAVPAFLPARQLVGTARPDQSVKTVRRVRRVTWVWTSFALVVVALSLAGGGVVRMPLLLASTVAVGLSGNMFSLQNERNAASGAFAAPGHGGTASRRG